MKKICQYLHEPQCNLPGQDLWKLSMTSKMFYSVIGKVYHMKTLRSNQNMEDFLGMLSQKPQLTKFLGD